MPSSLVHLFVGAANLDSDGERQGPGMSVFTFDEETLAVERVSTFDEIDNPTFLAVEPAGTHVYAVSEVVSLLDCTIHALAFDAQTNTLSLLNSQPTCGRTACFVGLHADGHVSVANYSHGDGGPNQSVAIYDRKPDGSLTPPIATAAHTSPLGPRADRQERNHPHAILPTPDGRFYLATDLGTDEVIGYSLDGAELRHAFTYNATPGSGPRHIAFHPDGNVAYVVNEIASSVTVLDLTETGLAFRQELSALPDGFTGPAWAADIQVSPDARYLYSSNRIHDSIAAFAIGPTGSLTFLGTTPSGGSWPRSFAITPSGRHLIVANHASNDIAIFARDPGTGGLTPTEITIETLTPMRIQAVDLATKSEGESEP